MFCFFFFFWGINYHDERQNTEVPSLSFFLSLSQWQGYKILAREACRQHPQRQQHHRLPIIDPIARTPTHASIDRKHFLYWAPLISTAATAALLLFIAVVACFLASKIYLIDPIEIGPNNAVSRCAAATRQEMYPLLQKFVLVYRGGLPLCALPMLKMTFFLAKVYLKIQLKDDVPLLLLLLVLVLWFNLFTEFIYPLFAVLCSYWKSAALVPITTALHCVVGIIADSHTLAMRSFTGI